MTRRSAADDAARRERAAAIRACSRCDPSGWLLASDGTPVDPAVRCTHASPSLAGRDITGPIHERSDQ